MGLCHGRRRIVSPVEGGTVGSLAQSQRARERERWVARKRELAMLCAHAVPHCLWPGMVAWWHGGTVAGGTMAHTHILWYAAGRLRRWGHGAGSGDCSCRPCFGRKGAREGGASDRLSKPSAPRDIGNNTSHEIDQDPLGSLATCDDSTPAACRRGAPQGSGVEMNCLGPTLPIDYHTMSLLWYHYGMYVHCTYRVAPWVEGTYYVGDSRHTRSAMRELLCNLSWSRPLSSAADRLCSRYQPFAPTTCLCPLAMEPSSTWQPTVLQRRPLPRARD